MDVGPPKFVIQCRFWQRGSHSNIENGSYRQARRGGGKETPIDPAHSSRWGQGAPGRLAPTQLELYHRRCGKGNRKVKPKLHCSALYQQPILARLHFNSSIPNASTAFSPVLSGLVWDGPSLRSNLKLESLQDITTRIQHINMPCSQFMWLNNL